MKKNFLLVLAVISLVVLGVFAVGAQGNSEEIKEKVNEISVKKNVSTDVTDFVEKFAEKRGVNAEEINDISEVNFEDLPKEVNIENVNDANLAIYGVNYTDNKESSPEKKNKQLFVITYSTEKLKAQGDIIIAQDKRMFLNFGSSGEMSDEGFLKTATGIEGSLEAGYVMMREGSITGISTNLEILNSSQGSVEIIIYKNGESINFGNLIDSSSSGVKKDHDVQSNGVVKFQAGDVISAKAKASGSSSWENVITMVEITTK